MVLISSNSTLQVDIDFEKEPIGKGKDGKDVYFKDVWPTSEEIAEVHTCKFSELSFLDSRLSNK